MPFSNLNTPNGQPILALNWYRCVIPTFLFSPNKNAMMATAASKKPRGKQQDPERIYREASAARKGLRLDLIISSAFSSVLTTTQSDLVQTSYFYLYWFSLIIIKAFWGVDTVQINSNDFIDDQATLKCGLEKVNVRDRTFFQLFVFERDFPFRSNHKLKNTILREYFRWILKHCLGPIP